MNHPVYFALLTLSMGSLYQIGNAVLSNKLADSKLCADEECSYVLSMALALDDFTAPDCRFINIRRDQMIYVYSKLKPAEGAGVFWSGSNVSLRMYPTDVSTQGERPGLVDWSSVYSARYVDQMGIIGYFPSNVVNETNTFQKETVQVPTTDMDFYCA